MPPLRVPEWVLWVSCPIRCSYGVCDADLTARYMQHLLPKGSQRLSNWERRPLSYEQQAYAASDAYASLRIHQVSSAP